MNYYKHHQICIRCGKEFELSNRYIKYRSEHGTDLTKCTTCIQSEALAKYQESLGSEKRKF